jgi:phage terminase large subunit GpA-like protein
VSLGIQRTANFTWTRKLFLVSTPGIAGLSRIEREWKRSDQRRFFVPCPHCDHRQHLTWPGIVWSQVAADEFDGTVGGAYVRRDSVVHLTPTAQYRCEGCGELIPEDKKPWMLRSGAWVPTRPEGEFPGFHLPALYSPWVTWPEMAREFLAKKDDPTELQTFVNTKLAEPWEDRGERVSAAGLEARAEAYVPRDGEVVEVPHGVGLLTFGTDVQGDRLEILVRGWGEGEESWDILHERIWGDPEAAETWARHEAIRTRAFRHASGVDLRIAAGMVDAGYLTDTVYGYVKPLEFQHVGAAMGDNGAEGNQPLRRPTRSNAAGVKLWTVGTFKLKDTVLKRLRIQRPGPRYMHLRAPDPDFCNGFDSEYFAQFESEKIITEIVRGSRVPRRKFVRIRKRNEALDLHVLNLAALLSQGRGMRDGLGELAKWANEYVEDAEPPEPEPPPRPEDDTDWGTGGGRWGRSW